MPTKKPSIHVVVEPEIAALYKRAAKAQNRSVSSLVGELITEIAPTIKNITESLEAAQTLPKEALMKMASDFAEAEKYFEIARDESNDRLAEIMARTRTGD